MQTADTNTRDLFLQQMYDLELVLGRDAGESVGAKHDVRDQLPTCAS